MISTLSRVAGSIADGWWTGMDGRKDGGMRWIPFALTTLRLVLAPVLIAAACWHPAGWLFVGILTIAVLSDIFDGVIARRLGIATPALRRYASAVDSVFWVTVCGVIWALRPDVVRTEAVPLAALFASEVATYVVAWWRYRATPATHSYAAKAFGVLLFAACAGLLGWGVAGWPFRAMLIFGVVVNAEILVMFACCRRQPVDTPTLWHALRR
jgi:CDP-diacylglycerol--glycerol-3-phosphate 3-phosphatidyltransferase